MTPLTARTYLEAYYDLSDPKNSHIMLPLLKELNGWDVIPVETLRNTWPKGEWQEPESYEATADEVAVPKLEKLAINTPDTSKSLREGAMTTVLQALLDGPDDNTDLLSEAEFLADFVPRLKDKLYEKSNALKPTPHILALLCRALEEETDVDLSPFTSFSAEDLSLVVSRLRQHGKMQTLCISNRASLTAEDVQVVLREATGLKALYLLHDPQISAQGLSPLLRDCDFYSSDLLRQAIKPELERYPFDSKSKVPDDAVPVGQLYENNDISQLVWIGVSDQQALDKSHRLKSGLIDWQTLRQEKGQTNFGWSGYGLRYKRYRLDVPLSTSRAVAGLLCLLQWGSSSHLYDVEQFSNGAALSFALASAIKVDQTFAVGHCNGIGIGPLAPRIYRDRNLGPTPADDAHEHLEPGKWAVLLIHEAYNAASQKFLDKCQRKEPTGADSDSEDENPLGQPKGGEGSLRGMMALLMGPRDPFENKGKNQGLPFRAIKRLRYALVTPCTEPQVSGHDFTVVDVPAYVEQTLGKFHNEGSDDKLKKLVEIYNSSITAMDTADFYGDEDIHDILPKVFPKQKNASSSFKHG